MTGGRWNWRGWRGERVKGRRGARGEGVATGGRRGRDGSTPNFFFSVLSEDSLLSIGNSTHSEVRPALASSQLHDYGD